MSEQTNNQITLVGYVYDEPVKAFKSTQGEQFYQMTVESARLSHTYDRVPVIFSQGQLKQVNEIIGGGSRIKVTGEVRSVNKPNPNNPQRPSLVVHVFSRKIEKYEEEGEDINEAILHGYLVSIKELRQSPGGYTICDAMMRVETSYKKYFIPVIAWGRLAEWLASMNKYDVVTVNARFQSRVYKKNEEERTAYEMSICKMWLDGGNDENTSQDTGTDVSEAQ